MYDNCKIIINGFGAPWGLLACAQKYAPVGATPVGLMCGAQPGPNQILAVRRVKQFHHTGGLSWSTELPYVLSLVTQNK